METDRLLGSEAQRGAGPTSYDAVPASAALQEASFTEAADAAGPHDTTIARVESPVDTGPATEDVQPSPKSSNRQRLVSLDLLRGIVMPLMAIDHAGIAFGNWQHGAESWSTRLDQLPPTNIFVMRLVTDPCAPAFTLTLGIGVVFFAASRLKLEWTSRKIMNHFLVRGLVILVANQVTALPLLFRDKVFLAQLPLFHLGFNMPIYAAILLAATRLEQGIASGLSRRRRIDVARASSHAASIVDALLLALTAGLIATSLAVIPPEGTSNDDRTWIFWFFFVPPPSEPVHHTVLFYAPFGWLSLGVFGLFLGRWLGRKKRTQYSLTVTSIVSAAVMLGIWVLTRIFDFGTLASRMLPLHPSALSTGANPLLENWKTFVYASKYPPDLSYWTLWVGVCLLVFAACESLPENWAERTPFLEFGRAPFFFYMAHFFVFILIIIPLNYVIGLPTRMGPGVQFWLNWAIACAILWFMCREFSRFKSKKAPDSLWRLF